MIVFAAITPHPPLLIPEIGRVNLRFVKNTTQSLQRLGEELYASKPDVIVIISPHGQMLADAFSINIAANFKIGFEEFGDLMTKLEMKGSVGLIHHYKEILEGKMPVVLFSQEKLDHGAGVPLFFLAKNIKPKTIELIPISFSMLDYKTHFEFGRRLQEDMINDTRRIAVIASGDLSHRLTEDAPAGYSHWAKKFDETIVKKVQKKDTAGLLTLDRDFIEEAGECGLRSIIILHGILNSIQYQPEIYSYEGPFGVGYMTVNFKLA